MQTNRITHCFLDADMRCGHAGLALFAKKSVDVTTLEPGQHVCFVNTEQNKLKMLSSGGTMTYLRLEKGRIDLAVIEQLPRVFGENLEMKYSNALRKKLESKLRKRRAHHEAKAGK